MEDDFLIDVTDGQSFSFVFVKPIMNYSIVMCMSLVM